jgi:hypothetical protein
MFVARISGFEEVAGHTCATGERAQESAGDWSRFREV